MKTIITAILLASTFVFSASVSARCADEALQYSYDNLTEKMQAIPKFSSGDITFDESNIGQYKNGVTLKSTSSKEEFFESTLAGLVKNGNTNESEFKVQRCLLFITTESCSLNYKKCTII